MASPRPPETVYRYGRAAWVWRGLMGLAVALSVPLVAVALRDGVVTPLLVALPLLAPSVYFAGVLAVRIDDRDDHLHVQTLGGWTRCLPARDVGPGRVRHIAQGDAGPIVAPRAFVRVRGGLPLYVDLLADIPDRPRLMRLLGLGRS